MAQILRIQREVRIGLLVSNRMLLVLREVIMLTSAQMKMSIYIASDVVIALAELLLQGDVGVDLGLARGERKIILLLDLGWVFAGACRGLVPHTQSLLIDHVYLTVAL